MTALPSLPAPIRPRKHRRTQHAQRRDNLRKALQFGPMTLFEARRAMCCTRFALHNTLRGMTDVVCVKGSLHLKAAAVVALLSRAAVVECATW